MGRIRKGVKCGVAGCSNDAVRSISIVKARAAGVNVEGRRAFLCHDHYRDFKKGSRKERKIERWRYGT